MKDNAMIERWNVIDSAAMAVAVEGILYRIENNTPLPFDFDNLSYSYRNALILVPYGRGLGMLRFDYFCGIYGCMW